MGNPETELTGPVPGHLPSRLTISLWMWLWLTETQEGEYYSDLEQCFTELVARGFNTIRIDCLLLWLWDEQGNPRRNVAIGNVAEPGYCNNVPGYEARGGFSVADPLGKLFELFELAKRHDVYLALSNWGFHEGHSTTFLANEAERAAIWAIPEERRLMLLAERYERLLTEAKRRGLLDRIAYVELHNELTGIAHAFGGRPATKIGTEEALSWLQIRFPELLFCGDYDLDVPADYAFDYNLTVSFAENFPSNLQVLDHHLYCFGIWKEFVVRAGFLQDPAPYGGLDAYFEHLEQHNAFYREVLKPDRPSWPEYKSHLTTWVGAQPLMYLLEHLDPERFDYWLLKHFSRYEDRMLGFWKNNIQFFGHLARQRNIPVVCDEGYIFWMPTNSLFDTTAIGRSLIEYIATTMRDNGYWGIMLSSYAFPGMPLWTREAEWLSKVNTGLIQSAPKVSGAQLLDNQPHTGNRSPD